MVNVLFFRVWGRIADRFSNKSVLTVSGPLFIISIVLWPLTTLPDRYVLTIPLIILIHILAGISTAGVNLCSGNIALKAAPYGRATAFLAVNGLVNGIAATLAPIIAGASADWFELRELRFTLNWTSPGHAWQLPAFDLRGLDFLFLLAGILGLYALHRLLAVKEGGEVEEEVVRNELLVEMRMALRSVSTVAGLRPLFSFPYLRVKSLLVHPSGKDASSSSS
ncbi:MAG: MFS transporter [Verrucomicrobia bacterium]|nr:MFS transporter [Verrucomicrobiota bacterium]